MALMIDLCLTVMHVDVKLNEWLINETGLLILLIRYYDFM